MSDRPPYVKRISEAEVSYSCTSCGETSESKAVMIAHAGTHTGHWQLIHPGRPWSLNEERTKHWGWRKKRTAEWRKAFAELARAQGVPPMGGPVHITVQPAFRGHRVQDVANCLPAVKAAVDGLRDAGVLIDDTPEHLSGLSFLAPLDGQPKDALILWIDLA